MTGDQGSTSRPVDRDSRWPAVKIAIVLLGVVNLVVAGILIGIPGFRTTLDSIPEPAGDHTTSPAAALSRSPMATPAPVAPTPATPASGTPVSGAPVSSPPASSSAGVPTTPGTVPPQGARTTGTRGPRAVRPQGIRPRKTSVATRHTSDALDGSPTKPPATSTGTPSPAPTTRGQSGPVPGRTADPETSRNSATEDG